MHAISPDRLTPAVVGAVCLLLVPAVGLAQTTRLIQINRAEPQRETARETWNPPAPVRRPQLSLSSGGGLLSRLKASGAGPERAPSLPDTIRILVLRLEFEPDQNPRTTGDGTFDLRDLETFRSQEGHDIDAAPHDRSFVQRHLKALHNYWWANSDGALNLVGDVFPTEGSESYRLPREMAYYGFETPQGDIYEAFELLVADAVRAADAGSDPISWESYDAFVLFHAGADWQGDAAGAYDTPADLPTAYVMLGEPVIAGSRAIHDATIVPETVSQDGFVGAINGVFVHEFGHQLGLPDLYDTMGMSTAVGVFALMDSGGETGGLVEELFVWGVLPAAISPWTRLYMGWVSPEDIHPGGQVDLVASTALESIHSPPPGSKIARIPAGRDQTFLVEFRSNDLDGDPSVSLFWEDGVIDGTGALIGDQKVRTFEYDALLPASGVLIWHLDEGIWEADPDGNGFNNFEENTLQQDRLRRFLDVEEADGLQELGWIPGYIGSAGDYWQPLPEGPERFDPFSRPNTSSWTGAPTGLVLELLDGESPLGQRLRVSEELGLSGWSAPLPDPHPGISVPWLIDPDSDGDPVVAVLDGLGGLHLWNIDGTPATGANPVWVTPDPPGAALTVAGDALVVTAGNSLYFLAEDGTETAAVYLGNPAVSRPVGYYGLGGARAIVGLDSRMIVEVNPAGIQMVWNVGEIAEKVLYGHDLYRIAAAGNQLFRLNSGGGTSVEVMWRGSGKIIDLVQFRRRRERSEPGIALLEENGRLVLFEPSGYQLRLEAYAEVKLPEPVGAMAVAHLEANRLPVIVVPTVDGVRAVETSGILSSGWPPEPRGRAAVGCPAVTGTPLTLAFGAVIGITDAGELALYGSVAEPLFGGVRQLRYRPVGPITLGAASPGSQPLLLIAASDSLRAVSLDYPGFSEKNPVWAGPAGGASGRGVPLQFLPFSEPQADQEPDILYVYPNPARDRCTIRLEGYPGELVLLAYTQSGTPLGEIARLRGGEGIYETEWDTSHLAPGVYFVVAEFRSSRNPDTIRQRRQLTVMVVR